MATAVLAPGDASRATNREGGDGAQARRAAVLDVAQRMGLPADFEVRFARGVARSCLMVWSTSPSN